MLRLIKFGLWAAGLGLALPLCASAQETFPDEPWAEVMLLGTFHFANPGQDAFNIEADDVLGEARQREIVALAEHLAAWQPDLVIVEARRSQQETLDETYAAWREGAARDLRNETYQLGARVADRLDHDRIYAADKRYQFMAEEQGELDLESDPRIERLLGQMNAYGETKTASEAAELARLTIGGYLHRMNTEDDLAANSDFYHRFLIRGWQGDNQGAAHTLGNWYTRNLLIYQNILRVVEEELAAGGERAAPLRVLVIFGQGHIPTLADFVEDSPYLIAADTEDWLSVFEDQERAGGD